MYKIINFVFFFSYALILAAQQQTVDVPDFDYPASFNYLFEEVVFEDHGETEEGFYFFTPKNPGAQELGLVVFMHGYGAYNPMVYGEWIAHIVKKGNVVIFPRYQKNLISPRTGKFVKNAVTGIKSGLSCIKEQGLNVNIDHMGYVGHSYGGVINAHIVAKYEALELPCPAALMCCSPGTGPFSGGILEDYSSMHEELKMLLMVSKNDRIVGDKFAKRLFREAKNVKDRNYIIQYPDQNGKEIIYAGHNESYSLNKAFDSGEYNITTKRSFRVASTDWVDYAGYWKLFDALMDCAADGASCNYALGNTEEQRFLGTWSDGKPVKALEILTPTALDDEVEAAVE